MYASFGGAATLLPLMTRATMVHQRRWQATGAAPHGGVRRGSVAQDQIARNEHLLGENSPFFHIEEKGYELTDDNMFIDRKAHGIPFHVDDDAALDAAYEHHQTAVEVLSVERVLLPFWLASASVGGSFGSEVLVRDKTTMLEPFRWHEVPDYKFSYPFEEHCPFNQLCATYDPVAAFAEDTCAGTHVPSMLLSRFELLQELESMEAPPRFIPFSMSTKTVVAEMVNRVDKRRLQRKAYEELRKFHGNYSKANVRFYSLVAEITKVRPVFLPMYSMQVVTKSNSEPLPLFVCGVTGRATGPVVHSTPYRDLAVGGTAGSIALVAGALTSGAMAAAGGAMIAAKAALTLQTRTRMNWATTAVNTAFGKLSLRAQTAATTDGQGYRWSVEDEETMEYSYREELRARARRRADFEQRVKEEAERDNARASGRKFKATRSRKAASPGTVDRDPLGYYELLGLKGQEEKATPKDIAKAFRSEAHKHHPDTVAPELQDQAKAKMQGLVEAYGVLRDLKLRKDYDDGFFVRPGGSDE